MAEQSVKQRPDSINTAQVEARALIQRLDDLLREIDTLNMAALLMCEGDGVSDSPELSEVAGVLTRQAESIRRAILARRALAEKEARQAEKRAIAQAA